MTGAEFSRVDIDLLADYIGGVLTGTPDESVVAALIADDSAWHAAYESLGGGMALVGIELGRLEPEPMPADLAARLNAMFATPVEPSIAPSIAGAPAIPAEPHLSVVRGDPASEDTARHVPAEIATRRGRRMRWAAPIAVAAGLVAFVGFGLDYLAGRDGSSSDTASSSAGVADQGAGSKVAVAPPEREIFASGIDYTSATLTTEPVRPMTAPELIGPSAKRAASSPKAPNLSVGDSALQPLTVPEALQHCLDAIEQANAAGAISVTSVDYARFGGAPAVIVRFTANNGGWAWASGPACGTAGTGAATLGKAPVR